MTLTQLRFIVAIADANLNITQAATKVHATQPGLSKQLKLLEDELGFQLFTRRARSVEAITPAGEKVLKHARIILAEAANIRAVAANLRRDADGELLIATTHTQARYVLPRPLAALKQRFPQVALHVAPGGDAETVARHEKGEADIAIVSSSGTPPQADLTLPIYRWDRVVLVPRGHPLTTLERELTLADIAAHPLISYESSRAADSSLRRAFQDAGLAPDISVTARDADLIKTYVRTGLGVGILAEMAVDGSDGDLVALPARGLFPTCTTWLLIRKDRVLRDYTEALIRTLIPEIDLRDLRRALTDGEPLHLAPRTWTQREDLSKPAPVGEFQI
ncbi:MAG: LysR family transcriptional regulator [Rhodanobacteraceae bacterium]|jgi:DNA-binding transcriptional LysR family regulator|nr:LysR family transcriptional regulator [Rhodanobacteraceae bacterium]MBL0041926.1 LysR family transcriptional regulator [Xanthomonadales bacterium]MBP6077816.1 LysR family transcriptional regulator [Xanthomonadales bacterium]MBP7623215.1 LysR family transcriptional regulator [Xanthomonadales bacterium]